jgi:hypothetical protein
VARWLTPGGFFLLKGRAMAKKAKKPANAKKKRTPSQKLDRMLERLRRFVKEEGPLPYDGVDWSDPVKRGAVANEVLSFGRETAGQSEDALDNYGVLLRRVFREAGMSPDNPHNWRFLIRMFAWVHFGPSDRERKYTAIASKVHALMASGEKKYIAVTTTAKHFEVHEKTVWNALDWWKKNFGLFRP